MSPRQRLKIFIFLFLLAKAYSFEFKDSGESGVELSDDTSSVNAEEDNARPNFTIVLIEGLTSEPSVEILSGSEVGMNPHIENFNGSSCKLTGNRVDYEGITTYQVLLSIKDSSDTKRLAINVINIDDEPPTLTISSCEMEENYPYSKDNASCVFLISDPDGWLNYMTYDISDNIANESNIFEFGYKTPPDNYTKDADLLLYLQDGVMLDYETITLYSFTVNARDSANHPTTPPDIKVIVQVKDMPDMPPVWIYFPFAAKIQEKTETTLQVRAQDGDFGINNEINFRVDDPTGGLITIDVSTGLISIGKIDRDAGNDQVVFTVTAYEKVDETSTLTDEISLLVTDIDDHIPAITPSGDGVYENLVCDNSTEISLDSTEDSKYVMISFCERSTELENLIIDVSDIDLGENATYTAVLKSETEIFLTGFQIIPGRGYENSTLTLTIIDPNLLDFETAPWKNIEIELYTEGIRTQDNNDALPITISLIDWNDESPIFDPSEINVTFEETIGIDEVIAVIQATDLDQEDIDNGLKHEILGTMANNIVEIEEFGGNVTTTKIRSFDYEKQPEVYIQIRATDAVGHSVTALLTCILIDVNDEDPRLSVSSTTSIEENQKDGTRLESIEITATDEDTDANLNFYIDWSNSYATKNSVRLTSTFDDYENCIVVQTEPGDTVNEASASLYIKETVPDNTPDFEIFDSLFIMLVVVDNNTVVGNGTDSAYIVINIEDINDNPPDLSGNDITRTVTENSENSTTIGTIRWYDPDTVGVVTLSIEPLADTPRWVTVNPTSGELTVSIQEGTELDCDEPPRYYLNYTITAFDEVHTVTVDISIEIIDQNENPPEVDSADFRIDEDYGNKPNETKDGQKIWNITYTDIDRDEPYHTVKCSFQSSIENKVQDRFSIEDNTIVVTLSTGATLNREEYPDEPQFSFQLYCIDNPNRIGSVYNQAKTPPLISISLDDVNDNVPTITTRTGLQFSERDEKKTSKVITGEDPDLNENGWIDFELEGYERYEDSDHTIILDFKENLFTLENDSSNKSATLSIASENLLQQYGFYILTIKATDRGNPPLSDSYTVELEVTRFNAKEIEFIFPEDSNKIYLSLHQDTQVGVKDYNNELLNNIDATDGGQNKYSIAYTIEDENTLFLVKNLGNSKGQIQMIQNTFDDTKIYPLTIIAQLDTNTVQQPDEASYNKTITVSIQFLELENTEPEFNITEVVQYFEEDNISLTYQLETPKYPDVDSNQLNLTVHYILKSDNYETFAVDDKTGVLSLLKPLDFLEAQSYELVIQASRTERLNPKAPNASKLTLTIIVVDVNNHAPVFDQETFYGTIVINTPSNTLIIQVTATDLDTTSQDSLTYYIDKIAGSNSDLQKLNDAFVLGATTGEIKSQTVITESMSGYFDLDIRVMDEEPEYHNGTAKVRINIVSKDDTVDFKFQNTLEDVRSKASIITSILDQQFKYRSHVHNPSTTDDEKVTLTPIYFIDDNNVPVEASQILSQVTNTEVFNQLFNKFRDQQLYLDSFQTSSDSDNNMEEVFKAWLIGVCVVLGALCVIVSVAFVLKTRSLNQRIMKLSSNKFGSQNSDLNRMGVAAAPTTNKHAIEGSNPIFNQEVNSKYLDRDSVHSGDSDLIGVEDDTKFDYNNYPTKDSQEKID